MSTFQCIVYAIIHAMSQFLPVGVNAHHIFVPKILDWQAPPEALMVALTTGSFVALLLYFRHDWASMISGFLQMIIYRRKPMTLDERLPLLLTLSCLPLLLSSGYLFFSPNTLAIPNVYITALLYSLFGLALAFFDYWGRKLKGTYDWNIKNALAVAMAMLIALTPAGDTMTAVLACAFFLNYRREAAAKYALFASGPILLAKTIVGLQQIDFHASAPGIDLSWLSFGISTLVVTLAGLLAIGGFMRHVQQKGMGHYVTYRLILALGTCVLLWYRA